MFRRHLLPALIAATIAAPGTALSESWTEGWSGRVTLYGWLTAIDGDIAAAESGLGGSISLSTSDVLDRTDLALFGMAEIRRRDWGLIVDAMYVDMSSSQGGPFGSRIDGDTDLTMVAGALTYRAFETDRVRIDPYAGLRFVAADVSLRARGSLPVPFDRTARADESWVDPLVGVRVIGDLTERLSLVGYADIGGFGAGSELTWHLYGGAVFSVTDRIDAEAGFRAMWIDYSNDLMTLDTTIFGPTIGLSVRF